MSHGEGVEVQSSISEEVSLGNHLADNLGTGKGADKWKRMTCWMRRRQS